MPRRSSSALSRSAPSNKPLRTTALCQNCTAPTIYVRWQIREGGVAYDEGLAERLRDALTLAFTTSLPAR